LIKEFSISERKTAEKLALLEQIESFWV